MNFTMNSILEETFEYRHKKFDQYKRQSSDSSNSSSEEYECIKVDIERVEERPISSTSSEISVTTSTTTNWSSTEMYESQAITGKRQRSATFGESSYSASETHATAAKRQRSATFGESSYSASEAHATAAKRMRTTASTGSTYSTLYLPTNLHTPRHTSTPLVYTSTPIPFVPSVTPSPFIPAVSTPPPPPPAAILPKISNETLRSICKYHGNMVRKFPKKERTPKDQDRRNKNTIACRMSRRVKKLEHVAIEEQYKEFTQQTFNIIEQSMRATAYLHELMKLSGDSNGRLMPSQESYTKIQILNEKPSASNGEKNPFTIAYLTGAQN